MGAEIGGNAGVEEREGVMATVVRDLAYHLSTLNTTPILFAPPTCAVP